MLKELSADYGWNWILDKSHEWFLPWCNFDNSINGGGFPLQKKVEPARTFWKTYFRFAICWAISAFRLNSSVRGNGEGGKLFRCDRQNWLRKPFFYRAIASPDPLIRFVFLPLRSRAGRVNWARCQKNFMIEIDVIWLLGTFLTLDLIFPLCPLSSLSFLTPYLLFLFFPFITSYSTSSCTPPSSFNCLFLPPPT